MTTGFTLSRLPKIVFGSGVFSQLPDIAGLFGKRVLLVTGRHSLRGSVHWHSVLSEFRRKRLYLVDFAVEDEPSPELVDSGAGAFRDHDIDVVVGIGGGSALDTAKAIAGLLRDHRSVMDYLEGVGPELPYQGPSVPLIAVPTTAGTGSEATKNAVLSVRGDRGFKKSFRHERLVPQYAIVDPDLLASCPQAVIAANGMDALTQLIESYVSIGAGPFTDALVESGLRAVRDGFICWYNQGDPQGREQMAFAALISGICLAQTGLGSVHGLASPLGGFFPIPHGVVCGTLVAEATRVNIVSMLNRDGDNPSLDRYGRISELLNGRHFHSRQEAWDALIALLENWTEQLDLPRLGKYGVRKEDIERIIEHARGGSMRTNPIRLMDGELASIIENRL